MDHTTTAKQPKPKEPIDFWIKTLSSLEQNAAELEKRSWIPRRGQSQLASESLESLPTLALASSARDHPLPTQRGQSRVAATEDKVRSRRNSHDLRPASHKHLVDSPELSYSAKVKTCLNMRNSRTSPVKTMNPSSSFSNVANFWMEGNEPGWKQSELAAVSRSFPASLPASNRSRSDQSVSFLSPTLRSFVPSEHELVSMQPPQHAQLHTPRSTPTINSADQGASFHFETPPPLPMDAVSRQTRHLSDVTPIFYDRESPLTPRKLHALTFGFDESAEGHTWNVPSSTEHMPAAEYATSPFISQNPSFQNGYHTVIPGPPLHGLELDINSNHHLAPHLSNVPDTAILPFGIHRPRNLPGNPPYTRHRSGPPQTPQRRDRPSLHLRTPSPSRTGHRSRRVGSSSRHGSRHRRTKSTNSPLEGPQSLETGSFVNYTPQDSSKLLNGVAPSGSSKTRARREKEAADKRRRLNQAAVQAVLDAGGDLEALNRAGFVF